MKKIVLLAVLICTVYSLQAQVYVGGSLGLWTDKQGGIKQSSFSILPEIGYAFNSHWNAGAVVGYGQSNIEGQNVDKVFQLTPYVDYTFYRNEIATMFLEAGASYILTKPDEGDSQNGYELGLRPGITVRLSEKFSMRAHLGFLGYKDTGINDSSSYGLMLDAEALAFGFHYAF